MKRVALGIAVALCAGVVSAGEVGFGITLDGRSAGWTIRVQDGGVEAGIVVSGKVRWFAAALAADGRVAIGGMLVGDVRPYASLRGRGADGYVGVESDLESVWGVGVALPRDEGEEIVEEPPQEKCEKYEHPPPCI